MRRVDHRHLRWSIAVALLLGGCVATPRGGQETTLVRRQQLPQRGTPYVVRVQVLTSPAGVFWGSPNFGGALTTAGGLVFHRGHHVVAFALP